MLNCRSHRRVRDLITGWLVVAFALRALLPQGFMPGSEPFAIKICPSDLAAGLLLSQPSAQVSRHGQDAHAHHAHHAQAELPLTSNESHDSHHGRADQCPFGGAAVAAPAPLWLGMAPTFMVAATQVLPRYVLLRDSDRDYRPQPRGPPVLS